jgi:hypothetical protein
VAASSPQGRSQPLRGGEWRSSPLNFALRLRA